MAHFSELLADINVSHDADTSGTFDFSSLTTALSRKRSAAEAWLRWALQRRLVLRVVQLICDHCGFKLLRPVEQTNNASCPRCGHAMLDRHHERLLARPDPPSTVHDREEAFCRLIEEASARAFSTHDPVRDLF